MSRTILTKQTHFLPRINENHKQKSLVADGSLKYILIKGPTAFNQSTRFCRFYKHAANLKRNEKKNKKRNETQNNNKKSKTNNVVTVNTRLKRLTHDDLFFIQRDHVRMCYQLAVAYFVLW